MDGDEADYDDDAFLYGDEAPKTSTSAPPPPPPMTTDAGSLAPVDDDDPFATLAGGVDLVHVDNSSAAPSTSTTNGAQPVEAAAQEEEEEEEDDEEDETDSDDDLEIVLDPTAGRVLDLRNPSAVKAVIVGHGLGASKVVPGAPPRSTAFLTGIQPTTEYTPSLRPSATTPLLPGSAPRSVVHAPAQSQQQIQEQYALLPPHLQAQQAYQAHQQALAAAAATGQPSPDPSQAQPHAGPSSSTPTTVAANGTPSANPLSNLPVALAPASDQPIDLAAAGILPDGRSIFEIDLDQLDKKDWRIPGSDISDWFNYGFDEVTWTAYVRRRREMNEMVDGLGMMSQQQMMPGFNQFQPQQQQQFPGQQQLSLEQQQQMMMFNQQQQQQGGFPGGQNNFGGQGGFGGMDGGMMAGGQQQQQAGMPTGPRGSYSFFS
ncbi:Fip1 motif-domain-containing protein [Mrakia frigida]|uniref:cleavage polyadenylation factor subunit FIP1 n=1 Tax=Mrakia frigida TaxID=29902 RepID=UPI003FCBF6C1